MKGRGKLACGHWSPISETPPEPGSTFRCEKCATDVTVVRIRKVKDTANMPKPKARSLRSQVQGLLDEDFKEGQYGNRRWKTP